jgi:hypothetical protein
MIIGGRGLSDTESMGAEAERQHNDDGAGDEAENGGNGDALALHRNLPGAVRETLVGEPRASERQRKVRHPPLLMSNHE